jgi:hypothetical protein
MTALMPNGDKWCTALIDAANRIVRHLEELSARNAL